MERLKAVTRLQKTLGYWDSVALVIGSVVGTGIFRTPSEVCRYISDPGWVLLAWALGGIIAFMGTLCYCELAASFPETGGTYVYLKYAYGPWAGFLFGWSELALMRTASMASVSYAFGEYLQSLIPNVHALEKWIAITAIWLLTLINVAGLQYGKSLQNFVSFGKVLALAILILLGLALGKGDLTHFDTILPHLPNGGFLANLGLALVPILWTYGGWHESTFVAGEFRRSDTDLPLSLVTATGWIIFFYLATNAVYLYLFPASEIAQKALIAGDVMQSIFGAMGGKVITVVIIVCIFGVLNTVILAGGRIPFAVGKDHSILKGLSLIHPKFHTPARSLVVNAAWASMLVLWGTFSRLIFLSAAAVWLFFAAAGVAVFVARIRFPERTRPFSMWGYPWTPLLFVLVSSWIFLNTAFYSPRETMLGFVIIGLGFPLYWLSKKMTVEPVTP